MNRYDNTLNLDLISKTISIDDFEKIFSEVKTKGYSVVSNFLPSGVSRSFVSEMMAMDKYQTERYLSERSAYISDKAPNRTSHSIMSSVSPNHELPSIAPSESTKAFLAIWNELNTHLTGFPVPNDSRSMVNFQNYRSSSSPVGPHHDGEYLEYEKGDSGYFSLLRGLLARYVGVYILWNENTQPTLTLKRIDISTGEVLEVINPECFTGDFVVFDNLMFTHEVGICDKPRSIVGIRNFDHLPYYYLRTGVADQFNLPRDWHKVRTGPLDGVYAAVPSEVASYIMAQFNKEWKESKYKEVLSKGAVF